MGGILLASNVFKLIPISIRLQLRTPVMEYYTQGIPQIVTPKQVNCSHNIPKLAEIRDTKCSKKLLFMYFLHHPYVFHIYTNFYASLANNIDYIHQEQFLDVSFIHNLSCANSWLCYNSYSSLPPELLTCDSKQRL